jgi:hypothetical protein
LATKIDKKAIELREEVDAAFYLLDHLMWDRPPVSYEICEAARKDFEKKRDEYFAYMAQRKV